MNTNKNAFTMTEILISLLIVGVIAVMILPNIVQKNAERKTISKLKKVYSTLSNAYRMSEFENESPNSWFESTDKNGSVSGANKALNKFLPYMKVSKVCYQSCASIRYHKGIDGKQRLTSEFENGAGLELQDGTGILFWRYDSDIARKYGQKFISHYGTPYIVIMVYINGLKKSITKGIDLFAFIVTDKGVFPTGEEGFDDTISETSSASSVTFKTGCNRKKNPAWNTQGCTAWVIKNENMDYLRCDDLSWKGKHACSKK